MIDAERTEAIALPRTGAGILAPVLGTFNAVATFSKRKPLGAVGGAITVLLVVVAILAPVLAPYGDREKAGEVHLAPSTQYILGTDNVGRDVLSRVIYGARISLYVGMGAVLIGVTAGFVLGVTMTYTGGALDMGFQRLVDALMALPGLIVALAIMAVLGPSLNNVIIAIVVGMLAPVIRTVRSQVLSLKELDYVLAAKAVGASSKRIVFRHIAPNCFATYLVLASYYLGFAIILEAGLSFLGVGSPLDEPSWGGMLSRANEFHIKTAPWTTIFPGLAIFIVVFGFNILGDALRDVFDPKLRGR